MMTIASRTPTLSAGLNPKPAGFPTLSGVFSLNDRSLHNQGRAGLPRKTAHLGQNFNYGFSSNLSGKTLKGGARYPLPPFKIEFLHVKL